MAPISTAVSKTTTDVAAPTTSLLDSKQTLRASTALLRKIKADEVALKSSAEKTNLLEDADDDDADDEIPVWLVLTTKKHVLDKKRLKPGKILLPHPYLDLTSASNLRICLITADPQRTYKDLIAHESFPLEISKHIHRVIGLTKLKAKYKSYESRRQLLSEYDLFLADDRVVTQLPLVLGKVFYARTSKRPIPVTLEGKREALDAAGNKRRKLAEGGTKAVHAAPSPAACAHEIARTLRCALVHLAPSTTTAVKVGVASQAPHEVQANIDAVVAGLVERFVPRKWKNVRAVHIKGPNTAALPIWMTDELWQDERDVLDVPRESRKKGPTKRKRNALTAGTDAAEDEGETVIEVPGPDGQMRRVVKPAAVKRKSGDAEAGPAKKRKSGVMVVDEQTDKVAEKLERAARKDNLKKQKAEAKAAAADTTTTTKKVSSAAATGTESTKSTRRTRLKAEEMF